MSVAASQQGSLLGGAKTARYRGISFAEIKLSWIWCFFISHLVILIAGLVISFLPLLQLDADALYWTGVGFTAYFAIGIILFLLRFSCTVPFLNVKSS